MAGLDHQQLVAGGETVHQRRFPGAGARGRVDHHRLPRLKYVLEAFDDFQAELAELRSAVIHGGVVDGAQDAVGHIGRSGYLQEMTTTVEGHGGVPRVQER